MLFAMSATGLCLFLCLYCVFGAGLFIALEAPGETKNHVEEEDDNDDDNDDNDDDNDDDDDDNDENGDDKDDREYRDPQ
nr:hypothetical protein BaRGS_014770 [Batillaria attramentaria]